MGRVKRRVALIVEDHPSLQQAMKKCLEEKAFDVLTALNYQSAVRVLESSQPSIVCVDLELPNESGYELCEYIRQKASVNKVPILVISDRGFPEDMAHAEEAGANAFLKKPFPMPRLEKYVNALLDGAYASRPSVRRLRVP